MQKFRIFFYICDHEMKIMAVNFKVPARDSHVCGGTPVKEFIKKTIGETMRALKKLRVSNFFSDDSEYPTEPWLMTPYQSAADILKKKYNECNDCKARNIVERFIRVCKG